MDLATAENVVVRAVTAVFEQNGTTAPALTPESVLVGADPVLDSLGVVSLIVEVEQIVETEFDVSIILASDKAMSQKNSPFRTVGVLAAHLVETVSEARAA